MLAERKTLIERMIDIAEELSAGDHSRFVSPSLVAGRLKVHPTYVSVVVRGLRARGRWPWPKLFNWMGGAGHVHEESALRLFRMVYGSARDRGFQPSLREMAKASGCKNQNSVVGRIDTLISLGYIAIPPSSPRQSRAWIILKRPDGSPFTGFAEKP